MYVYNTPQYDDFTGFTFNGQHSSQFGLLRTSNSNRYEDDLVLSHKDEAADIPGGPGQHYFGESMQARTFSINVAYDNIGEVDKRRIKKWLHPDDKLHELIFDERPYVKYWVKCSKQVTASELCFNELDKNGKVRRVYKGEIKIEFTAYMPYGVAVDKFLINRDQYYIKTNEGNLFLCRAGQKPNAYALKNNGDKIFGEIREGKFYFSNTSASIYQSSSNEQILSMDDSFWNPSLWYDNLHNIDEWAQASGLLETKYVSANGEIDKFVDAEAYIYNPGDVETGFKLTFELGSNSSEFTIKTDETDPKEFGHILITTFLPEEWYDRNNDNKYCVIDQGYKYYLNSTGEKTASLYIIDEHNNYVPYMTGQIIQENEADKFESFDNGQIYDIYGPIISYSENEEGEKELNEDSYISTFIYTGSNVIEANKAYYAIDDNQRLYFIYYYYFDSLRQQAQISFLDGEPVDLPETLYIAQSNDVQIMFGLKQENEEPNDNQVVFLDNYYCTLHIPSSASTKPSDWSEAQKMLFNGGKVIIDTNKKTINYEYEYFEDKTELIGVSGVIKQGTLFKLPVDDFVEFIDKGKKNYGYKTFLIQPDEYTTIINPTIEYNYLYK